LDDTDHNQSDQPDRILGRPYSSCPESGRFIFSLQFSTVETVVVLIVLNFSVGICDGAELRLGDLLYESIGFAGAALISFAMGMYQKELKLAHKYHKRQEKPSRTD
jgi:hypothetical protein